MSDDRLKMGKTFKDRPEQDDDADFRRKVIKRRENTKKKKSTLEADNLDLFDKYGLGG